MPERDNRPTRKRKEQLPAQVPPERFIEVRVPRGRDPLNDGVDIEVIGGPDEPLRRVRIKGISFNRELAAPDEVISNIAPGAALVGEAESDEKVLRFGPEDVLLLETNERRFPGRPTKRRIRK